MYSPVVCIPLIQALFSQYCFMCLCFGHNKGNMGRAGEPGAAAGAVNEASWSQSCPGTQVPLLLLFFSYPVTDVLCTEAQAPQWHPSLQERAMKE